MIEGPLHLFNVLVKLLLCRKKNLGASASGKGDGRDGVQGKFDHPFPLLFLLRLLYDVERPPSHPSSPAGTCRTINFQA